MPSFACKSGDKKHDNQRRVRDRSVLLGAMNYRLLRTNEALSTQVNWTWDFFLTAAEKCFKGGYPFGMPMSTTGDAVNWVGTMFAAHGVRLVDCR
jgi:hypothetical protein